MRADVEGEKSKMRTRLNWRIILTCGSAALCLSVVRVIDRTVQICSHEETHPNLPIAMNESSRRQRSHASLLVIDIQERLLPAIFERERVVQNAVRLVKRATVLAVPVFSA